MRKIYLDTETTGLKPGQIAQLSMIIHDDDDGSITGKNYFFTVNNMEDGAKKVCGRDEIFYANMSNGKTFSDYKDELFEILSSGIIIAHNIKFDENFISIEFWRNNIIYKPINRFDTMTFFKDIIKLPPKSPRDIKYKNPKLVELVDYFNIDKNKVNIYAKQIFGDQLTDIGFHDAMYDTTSMFVACQIYNDRLLGLTNWEDTFRTGV